MKLSLLKIAAVLMLLNGLFFMSNIYVLGDTPEAIAMHDDLARDASPFMVQGKVVNCFLVGLGYLISGIGILRNRPKLGQWGFWAAIFFIGFYLVELVLWGKSHPRVWTDFAIFGGISAIWGILSYRIWRKSN